MIRDAVIRIRKNKLPDPKDIGNAGSFFKNPSLDAIKAIELKSSYHSIPIYKQNDDTYKVAAGWLIEQCGWKGKRIGNAGVYEKQALVLVNYGGAKGHEILDLAESICDSVNNRFSVRLEMEVNIV
jgi:UDP-N-acetylmuramate dehydrogenase